MADPPSTSTDAATTPVTGPSGRPRVGWWVAGGWVALVALHVWLARGVVGPIVLQDETGYLGNARWLAGLSPVPEMGEQPFYAWGYSLLVAPLSALVDDPALLYRTVQVLNSVLLATLLSLLWVALRRVGGVEPRTAAIAAAVGSVFPSTLVHSSVAWAESLLPVLMVLLVLVTWVTLTERPAWQRMWVAPVAVLAYASHPRFLPALGLVVIGLVAGGVSRRLPALVAGVGVATGLAGIALVRVVDSALVGARWPERVDEEGSAVRLLARLANPVNWPALAGQLAGQGWYLAATSLGLAAAGALGAAWWVRRGGGSEAQRLSVSFIGVVILGLFVTSAVSFVGSAERVDHLIYGRYNEAWVPLLVAVGGAAVMGSRGHVRTRLLIGSAGLVASLGLVVWLGRGPSAFTGEVVWNNVLGLRLVMELVGQRWMVPGATLLAVIALVGFLASSRRPVVGLSAGGLLLVVMAAVAVTPLADFARVRYDGWELPAHLGRVVDASGSDVIALERGSVGLVGSLGYPFWLPTTEFRFDDLRDLVTSPPLVVSSIEAPHLDGEGARLVALDARNAQGVWVLPDTDEFDRLTRAGAVLPSSFPSRLDAAASERTIELVGSHTVLEVRAGEVTTIALRVVHAGTGAGGRGGPARPRRPPAGAPTRAPARPGRATWSGRCRES